MSDGMAAFVIVIVIAVALMSAAVGYNDGKCAGTCYARGVAESYRDDGCWCRTSTVAVRVYR